MDLVVYVNGSSSAAASSSSELRPCITVTKRYYANREPVRRSHGQVSEHPDHRHSTTDTTSDDKSEVCRVEIDSSRPNHKQTAHIILSYLQTVMTS